MRRLLMILLPAAVVALGAFGAFTMIKNRPEPEQKPVEIAVPLVRVIEAKPQSVRLTIRAEGTVVPRTVSELVPEVSGRVLWISPSVVSGGFFEEGEELLRIDAREYELAVIRARAAIAQAKLRVATEEQEAAVARKEWASLGEGEASPLVMREPQIAEAEAALASAEAALHQTEYDLERTVLKAPFAGRVRSEQVDVGQFVQRGTSVAQLYAVDFAEVRLPIADAELAFVDLPLAYRGESRDRQGPAVTLRAEFGGSQYEWQGRIVRTEGEIDPRTRMVHAVAQVADPYGRAGDQKPPLAVGMFVEAEIQGQRASNVISLPRTVLRGEDQVMVIDGQSRLHFRRVDILRAERDQILVRSGLQPGDRVVISRLEAAVNGMKVEVLEDSNEKPA